MQKLKTRKDKQEGSANMTVEELSGEMKETGEKTKSSERKMKKVKMLWEKGECSDRGWTVDSDTPGLILLKVGLGNRTIVEADNGQVAGEDVLSTGR